MKINLLKTRIRPKSKFMELRHLEPNDWIWDELEEVEGLINEMLMRWII